MDNVIWFRQLRRGPPRRLSLPHCLGAWRPRLATLRRSFGFHALVAVIGVAAFLSGPWFSVPPSAMPGAAVVDGDSLRAGNIAIRLDGIDAPELRQSCRDERGGAWPCGRVARERLRALVARGEVACTNQGRDRYGRTLAICAAGDVRDLGEAMVRAGYAMNYDRFTRRYAAAEADARAQRRGLWRGLFERPEDWRAGNRRRQSVGWSGR